jgi:preprotein translocase subunit SecG
MGTLISILIIIICLLLILAVLVQNSKGGGLASSFASSNQVMGVRKTADFLEKATWTLAISLVVLSIMSTSFNKPTDVSGASTTESETKRKASEAPVEMPAPGGSGMPGMQSAPNPGQQPNP